MSETPKKRTAILLAGAVFLLVLGLGAALLITAPGRLDPPPAADPVPERHGAPEAGRKVADAPSPAREAKEAHTAAEDVGAPTHPSDTGLKEVGSSRATPSNADAAEPPSPESVPTKGEEDTGSATSPEDEEPEDPVEEPPPPSHPPGTLDLAEPHKVGLLKHITEADPRDKWPHYPDTPETFAGHHGQILSLRVNTRAEQALTAGEEVPHGGMLTLDVYDGLGKVIETYVMTRWKGIDPTNADWIYARYDGDGKAIRFGKVFPCIECHMKDPARGALLKPPGLERKAR